MNVLLLTARWNSLGSRSEIKGYTRRHEDIFESQAIS